MIKQSQYIIGGVKGNTFDNASEEQATYSIFGNHETGKISLYAGFNNHVELVEQYGKVLDGSTVYAIGKIKMDEDGKTISLVPNSSEINHLPALFSERMQPMLQEYFTQQQSQDITKLPEMGQLEQTIQKVS